jgi:hypothetical protein
MDNNLYNLMLQLTQEQKSIWRVKRYYIGDAGNCEECKTFWTRFLDQKEDNVAQMKELIKRHIG